MLKAKQILIVIALFVFSECYAQTDNELLRGHVRTETKYADREVAYGFDGVRYKGIVYHTLSASMYVYQKYLSQVFLRDCAFQPTCSAYSKELISDYGLFKGVILTTDRLTRCTRISLADKNKNYFDFNTHKHYESTDIYRKQKPKDQK